MFIIESKLRNIVRNELKKVLFEQDIASSDSETGTINVELPQQEEDVKITMSAEEIADIATEIADSEPDLELASSPQVTLSSKEINDYLNERKIK